MIITLTTAGVGFYNATWQDVPANGKEVVVRPPDNADTDYIRVLDSASRQSFVMTQLADWVLKTITHTISNRSRNAQGAGQSINGFIRKAGADTDGTPVAMTGSYVTNTSVDLGGAVLTRVEANAAEIGVYSTSMGGFPSEVRCTTLFWDVTVDTQAGGFIAMVCQLLGAAVLGSGLLVRDAVALANAMLIRSRGKMRVEPGDLTTMLGELRAWRHVATA